MRKSIIFRNFTSAAAILLTLSLNYVAYSQEDTFSKSGLHGLEEFRMAIVSIKSAEKPTRSVGDGVIVTPEGHVLMNSPYRSIHAGDKLKFKLLDGRVVLGETMGWSGEWGIALAKISDEGPRNHVVFSPSEKVKPGISCISLGELTVEDPLEERLNETLLSFGRVKRVAGNRWLTSTCPMNSHNGVFDYKGRLLGMTTVITVGDDEKVQTHVAIVKNLWEDLVAGKNIDKVRALSLANRLPKDCEPKEQGVEKFDAIQVAKRTTVRIRSKEGRGLWDDPGWSGVVVTAKGHVATCGHHDLMPGEEVTVHFSDGKVASGVVLGTNRVTDIGIVKITDNGNWPFAKLGLSQTVLSDSPCIFAGYPAGHRGKEPIVRKGKIAIPEDYVWNHRIFTSGIETQGGDSGGGLFNVNGELIGTHEGGARAIRSEFFHLQWKDLTSGMPIDVDRTWGNSNFINVVSLGHRFEPKNHLVRWRWKLKLPDSPEFLLHCEASSDTPDFAPESPGTLDSAGIKLPAGESQLDLSLTTDANGTYRLKVSAGGVETVQELADCDIFEKPKFLRKIAGSSQIESEAPSRPFLLAMLREHASTGPATPTGGMRMWLEPAPK